jgi:hypothetical protein
MKKSKGKPGDPANTLVVARQTDETDGQAMARILLGPDVRHGCAALEYAGKVMGPSQDLPGITDTAGYVSREGAKAAVGELDLASRMLAAQAITLDSMFTEFARRAALNMGEYLNAGERYARLAMKAQSNCRTTLESLAKLHQPREQTVRHVHVNDGGQAIVADEFHHHTGGRENGKSNKQSDAAGAVGESAALPCPDALGNGVSITGRAGKASMQDARRHQSGCA